VGQIGLFYFSLLGGKENCEKKKWRKINAKNGDKNGKNITREIAKNRGQNKN
jgi:hypothetical protein